MKIFGIGPNKTGTLSLTLALQALGYNCRHDHFANKRDLETMTFNEFDAYFDGPLYTKYKELDQAYPGSKFILTTRDFEEWIQSRICHILYNRMIVPNHVWRTINTPGWEKEWNKIHTEIPQYFAGRQQDFLIMNIPAGDEWDVICSFLGKEILNIPFPIENRSEWRLEQCLAKYKERKLRKNI